MVGVKAPEEEAMPLTEKHVRALVMRYTVRTAGTAEDVLANDFAYVNEIGHYERSEFLSQMDIQTPWETVSVLGIVFDAAQAAAFFEGVDPVTNLLHRIAWLLDHDGASITKITAVHTLLDTRART